MAIELDAISFSYDRGEKETVIFKDFSFGVEDGEIVTVVGPSGCGKTTLVRIMAGLVRPASGDVLMKGAKIQGPSRERGVVFQGDTCFPWLTVLGNVSFGLRGHRGLDECEALIRSVGLWEERERFPVQLSLGMRQRVSLARAIAAGAQVLLLDEPLGALDALTRGFLQKDMRTLLRAPGRAALWVTHDLEEALLVGDKIVVIAGRPLRVLLELRPLFEDGDELERRRLSSRLQEMKRSLYETLEKAYVDFRPKSSGPDIYRG